MKKYYKVTIHSEYLDLEKYNQTLIVEKGLIYAKEIATNEKIMICDCIPQGIMHDYYVLSRDFNIENVARYEEIVNYLTNFELAKFPIYSNMEAKQVKKLIRARNSK